MHDDTNNNVTAIQSNESDTYEVLKSMSDTVKAIHTSLQQLESQYCRLVDLETYIKSLRSKKTLFCLNKWKKLKLQFQQKQ